MARRAVKLGDAGADVTELQELLCSALHMVAITSRFTESTGMAVRNFQRMSALEPTGVVCSVTWAALDAAKARGLP